jgi:hypothetical protein
MNVSWLNPWHAAPAPKAAAPVAPQAAAAPVMKAGDTLTLTTRPAAPPAPTVGAAKRSQSTGELVMGGIFTLGGAAVIGAVLAGFAVGPLAIAACFGFGGLGVVVGLDCLGLGLLDRSRAWSLDRDEADRREVERLTRD